MNRKQSSTLALTLICLILGFMMAINFRTQQDVELTTGVRDTELRSKVIELVNKNENLETHISELEKLLNEYRTKSVSGESTAEILTQELDQIRHLAGLTDVKGQGVVVTINDATSESNQYEDPNLFIVHDEDLLNVVNVLKAAGAEAISVNGLRIVAQSEISCAGPVILVNQTRLAPPYVVSAIGDMRNLESSLNMRGGIVEKLRFWGIEIEVDVLEDVFVPSYKGKIDFKFLQPVKEGE